MDKYLQYTLAHRKTRKHFTMHKPLWNKNSKHFMQRFDSCIFHIYYLLESVIFDDFSTVEYNNIVNYTKVMNVVL